MAARLPIGTSDFAQLRREGLLYADKTALVTEIVRGGPQVLLLPRPRRFGKTLNLTMLRAFFERGLADAPALFEGLAVTRAGEDVLAHLGRHPVVYLTFKDLKHPSWERARADLARILALEVERHLPGLEGAPLPAGLRSVLEAVAARSASETDLQQTLALLTEALHRATGERAVLLVDEYDTPLHAALARGGYGEAADFLRNLLSAGLKDNPHLYRGVLTGILRVAKESIFSGLNNVAVYTLLSARFSTSFGFTREEVDALAAASGQTALLPALRDWYDGYRVGDGELYNPWSVLNALANPRDGLRPYWVNTASDELLRDLFVRAGLGVQDELAALIRGDAIHRPVDETVSLRDLSSSASALWSFLLMSGYLTPERPLARDPLGGLDSPLRVPNREVSVVYRTVFQRWMSDALRTGSDAPQRLGRALLSGDEATFRGLLGQLVLDALSYHDVGGRQPEAVYQAFVVGLLVVLEASHEVRSNRESGFGRYDVLLRPRRAGEPGAVLELKVLDPDETPSAALASALAQVRARDYAAELRAAGADPIWRWAAVFDGKRVWVEGEGA